MKHLLAIALLSAAVSFNPADGTGSATCDTVGAAFGWDSSQTFANSDGVTFATQTVDDYSAVCSARRHLSETKKVQAVSGVDVNRVIVEYPYPDGPTFVFTGYGYGFTRGAAPVQGAACTFADGSTGTWSQVTQAGSVSGLFATYGASSALIY